MARKPYCNRAGKTHGASLMVWVETETRGFGKDLATDYCYRHAQELFRDRRFKRFTVRRIERRAKKEA